MVLAAPEQASRMLAGPGTGKRTLIICRYAYLAASGVAPENILAVTSSRPLALALRARIEALFPAGWGHAHRPALEQITTLPALCRRLLHLSGDPRQVIAKPWQAQKILRELAKPSPPAPQLTLSAVWLEDMFRRAKAGGVGEDEARAFFRTAQAFEPRLADSLAQLYAAYNRRLREARLLTHDDMIGEVEIRLKQDTAFRKRWQTRFQYVFVDEAQELSAQALRILATLAAPQNASLVTGDPDQRLGCPADAVPEQAPPVSLDRFMPEACTYSLSINFRSTRQIVAASQRLIAHNKNNDPVGNCRNLLRPHPDAREGAAPTFHLLATAEEEAHWIADQIETLLRTGRRPGDILIGARTRAQLVYIEDELARRDLPYLNLYSPSFWQRTHIRDLIDHLALALDRSERGAFRRICNIPSERLHRRRLGHKFLEACGGSWSGMTKALTHPDGRRWQAGMADLQAWMNTIGRRAQVGQPAEVLRFVLESGYWDHVTEAIELSLDEPADDIPEEREDEIEALLKFARRFDTCRALVAYARRRQRPAAQAADRLEASIILATLHKLKGQVRPVAFGLGWCEGEPATGRWPTGCLPHSDSLRDKDPRAIQAERRLAYLLVTRATELCRLSGFARHPHTGAVLVPSRFAAEMGLGPAEPVCESQPLQRVG
ncbi:MAG: ATP-dependent helicase [Anaerolineales bacterium]|nr:ATP-dependent helicase [Anaerolineales bacterium]